MNVIVDTAQRGFVENQWLGRGSRSATRCESPWPYPTLVA